MPKTIDNDILLLDRAFGFQTAVDEAVKAIRSANIEARSADNGVGLVRLMGRQSGFIAMHAALASGNTDVCLIPEIDCPLEGQGGVLAHIIRIVEKQNHAVVVVAEGAGQEQLGMLGETDAVGTRFCKTLPSICNKSQGTRSQTSTSSTSIPRTWFARAGRTDPMRFTVQFWDKTPFTRRSQD